MDDKTWALIEHQSAWLESVPGIAAETRVLSQILKVTEEAGEVAQAVIGATGQNPRKGYSHSWDDVAVELCDVVISALVALNRVAPDARRVFSDRVDYVYRRSVAAGAEPAAGEVGGLALDEAAGGADEVAGPATRPGAPSAPPPRTAPAAARPPR